MRLRLGRMAALRKSDGGVRGIVVGDFDPTVGVHCSFSVRPCQPAQGVNALHTFCKD